MMNEREKKMLVISTQYKENYGTPEHPYWKFKGGSECKIINAPVGLDVQEFSKKCGIMYKNDMAEEYVLGWSWQDDEWLSEFERQQLEYDGKIRYPEPVIDYNEVMEAV